MSYPIITNKWHKWNRLVSALIRSSYRGFSVVDEPVSLKYASKISLDLFDTLPADTQLQIARRCLFELPKLNEAYNSRYTRRSYAMMSSMATFIDLIPLVRKGGYDVYLIWSVKASNGLALHLVGVQDSLGHVVQL
jgi:hypothetical protein